MAGEGGPVEVRLTSCDCPGTPHADGDLIYLRPRADMNMGLAAQVALRQSGNYRGDAESALLSVMVRYGVIAWTCRDAEGPVRVTTDAVVERLGWSNDAMAVMAKARELYWDTVLAPLVPAKSDAAPGTPSDDSTSPSPESGLTTPTSSEPSSPSEPVTGRPSKTTGG